jgi:glycogen(starch) synthase
MKVFAVTPWYLPLLGGIEVLVNSLAAPLREGGVAISVVTDDMGKLPGRDLIEGTPVHRLNFTGAVRSGRPGAPLQVLQQLRQLFEQERPDLIHMHCVTGSGAWYIDRLLKSASRKIPFVVTQHGVLEAIDRMAVIRGLLQRADAVTAVSQAALQSALGFAGSDNGRGVIPNGIEPYATEPSPAAPMPPSRPSFSLLCVGRLQQEKGFDLAIRALASLRSGGVEANLTIIGEGEDRATLEALIRALGLSDRVHLVGPQPNGEVRRLMAQAHLVLVPSRTREGFSLVAAEAAMAGVPAIVARIGGLPETVLDGQTGLVVAANDPEAIAAAVRRLLEDDTARAGLGRKAQARAMEEYSVARCVRRYLTIYRSLLDSHQGEPSDHAVPDSSQPCLA